MDPMGAPKDCDLPVKASPPFQTAAWQRWRRNHDTTRHIRRRGDCLVACLFHVSSDVDTMRVYALPHAKIRVHTRRIDASACGVVQRASFPDRGWKSIPPPQDSLFKDFSRIFDPIRSSVSFLFFFFPEGGWWIESISKRSFPSISKVITKSRCNK